MAYQSTDSFQKLRANLQAGNLGPDDVSKLEELISGAEQAAKLKESATELIGGRKVLLRLPNGIDLVK